MKKKNLYKPLSFLVGGMMLASTAFATTSLVIHANDYNMLVSSNQAGKQQNLREVDLGNLANNAWYRNDFVKYENIPLSLTHSLSTSLPNGETVNFGNTNLFSGRKVSVGRNQYHVDSQMFKHQQYLNNFSISNETNFSFNLNNVPTTKKSNVTRWEVWPCIKFHGGASCNVTHSVPVGSTLYVSRINLSNEFYDTNYSTIGTQLDRAETTNINVKGNLNRSFETFSVYEHDSEFSYDKLLSVDDRYTFRGFKTNNVGLKANDDYIKTIFVMSVNLAKANDMIKQASPAELNNPNFNALIKGLVNGQLVDLNDPLLKDTFELSHEDLGGVEYSLGYMYGLYASGIDVTQYLSTQPKTEFGQLADKYELSVNDPYLAYKLSNLFFNKVGGTATNFAGVEFNVTYTTSSNSASGGQIRAQIIFNEYNKKFELYTKGANSGFNVKGLRIIDNESTDSANSIVINRVDVVASSDMQNYTYVEPINEVGFYSYNGNTWVIRDHAKSAEDFEPSKLISVKDDFTKKELTNLFGELNEKELTEPSLILKDEEQFTKLSTLGEFSNGNDPIIEIVDQDLKDYILTNATTNLFENNRFKEVVENIEINPFDSVSGIGYDIKFKAFNRKGNLTDDFDKKPKATATEARFQTKATVKAEVKNEIVAEALDNFEFDKNLSFKDNVIEQLIDYEDLDKESVIIATDLAKQDWKVNSFKRFKQEIFDPNGVSTGTLTFKDEVSAADWLNFADKKQVETQTQSFTADDEKLRTITFTINNKKLEILPEPEQTLAGEFDWNLVYIILAIAGGALILIFIAFITHRNIKAKKALTDEDDE